MHTSCLQYNSLLHEYRLTDVDVHRQLVLFYKQLNHEDQ